jgi:hypothetical protein
MPAKLDRCVAAVMASGKSEEQAYAICNAQLQDSYSGQFRDAAIFDPVQKTAISVRDGVLEYLGAELGMSPPDKMFKVYRSPATIANVAAAMPGLPITDGHVALDTAPPTGGGSITDAKMVDARDDIVRSTLAILNQLQLSDTLLMAVEAGANELSLGYTADLVPHDDYDFEQRNIRPHHLAAVERGRCGAGCSFLDRKPETPIMLHKIFTDAEGALNLQQVVEIATAVPEAIKSVDVKDLPKLLPALQAIVEAAKGAMPAEESEPVVAEEPEEKKEPEPVGDEEPEEKKEPFTDAAFVAFVDAAVRKHAVVIEKARQFLPDTYSFADKATVEIMRDTLATVEKDTFSDEELPLAFKLLKKPAADYRQFGDAGVSAYTTLADKEL